MLLMNERMDGWVGYLCSYVCVVVIVKKMTPSFNFEVK